MTRKPSIWLQADRQETEAQEASVCFLGKGRAPDPRPTAGRGNRAQPPEREGKIPSSAGPAQVRPSLLKAVSIPCKMPRPATGPRPPSVLSCLAELQFWKCRYLEPVTDSEHLDREVCIPPGTMCAVPIRQGAPFSYASDCLCPRGVRAGSSFH